MRDHFAVPIIQVLRRQLQEAGVTPDPAKSLLRIKVYSFWMKCRNFPGKSGTSATAHGGQSDPDSQSKRNLQLSGGLYVMCCNEPLSLWLLSGFKQMYLYCRRDHTLYGKNQSPSSGQIDISTEVPPVSFAQLHCGRKGENSATIRKEWKKYRKSRKNGIKMRK